MLVNYDKPQPVKFGKSCGQISHTLGGITTSGNQQIFSRPLLSTQPTRAFRENSENISLRPKSLAILGNLLERPQQIVAKQELMRALWPHAKVLDAPRK
jgi:DNA-binding response OmpR family regulator